MAKKLTIDNPAVRFFSEETIKKAENEASGLSVPEDSGSDKPKRKPGRPKKENKRVNFTLTMSPDLHAEICDFAEKRHISFSQAITDIWLYYKEQQKS